MAGLKLMVLSVAGMSGLIALCRRFNRSKVRILAYHGVDWITEPVVNWDGLQVRPRVFRTHMEELKRNYTVIPLRAVIEALISGDELPPNAVAVTFDDGYRNNLTLAAPILKEFGFPATFFVSTGYLDGIASPWWYRLREAIAKTQRSRITLPDGRDAALVSVAARTRAAIEWERSLRTMPSREREGRLEEFSGYCGVNGEYCTYPLMNRCEIRELIGMGFEVGPHTVTHISMSHEDKATVEQEINASLSAVSEIAGTASVCYSYPHGALPKEYEGILNMMKARGVKAAVTTAEGMVVRSDDVFRLKRLNVSGHRVPAFASLLSGFTGLVHKD